MRALAEERGWKAGDLFMAIRVAVTGRTATPPLFDSLVALGPRPRARAARRRHRHPRNDRRYPPDDAGTTITHETVQAWLDAYVARLGDLRRRGRSPRCSPRTPSTAGTRPTSPRSAATRSSTPGSNPGGNAERPRRAGHVRGEYQPFAVDGNRAVAVGTCTYWTDASRSKVDRIYYNNWLLEFDDDGTCSSFTEYWMSPRKS